MEEAAQRKLDVIAECLGRLPQEVSGLNRLESDGVLHNVQVAIDAAMDLAAVWVKGAGHVVEDDYHNLATLQEAGRVGAALADRLRRLNGLRNAIVHKYNKFEEDTVLEALGDIREALLAFAEQVEGHDGA